MSNYIEIINGRKNKINLIGDIVGNSYSQSLTYKSIDCDYNTLTNITPSNIKSSALAIGAGDNDKLTTKGYVSDLISLNLTAYIKLQGDWDVINNNPDITGTTNVGFAWKVYNASEGYPNTNTILDGIDDWKNGDLAVKTSTGWMLVKGNSISLTWGSITGDVQNQVDLIQYFNDKFEVKGQLDSLHNLGLYQGNIEDLGMHWVEIPTTFSDIQAIYHVKYLEQGIVLAGSYGGTDDTGLRIYRSNDYGLTFPTTIQLPTQTNDNGSTFQILYLQNGIVLVGGYHSAHASYGYTYRSTDYGLTWARISMPVSVNSVLCYCDLEGGNVLAGCSLTNKIFKSTDYGATWSVIGTMGLNTSKNIQTITYLGSNTTQKTLIGGSTDNNVYKSVDGGITWTSCFTATSTINCSSYFGNGVVVVGTENGTLYRSYDYGVTWVSLGGNRSIRFITYVGSGVAFYTTSNNAAIYKTIDNGSHWYEIPNVFSGHTYSLKMSYAGNGLLFSSVGDVSGGTAKIYRSTIFEPITHPIFNGIKYTYPTINSSGVLSNDGNGILSWDNGKADLISSPSAVQQLSLLNIDSNGQYKASNVYYVQTESDINVILGNATGNICVVLLNDITYTSSTFTALHETNILFTGKNLTFSSTSPIDLQNTSNIEITFHNIVKSGNVSNSLTLNNNNAGHSIILNIASIESSTISFTSTNNQTYTVTYQDTTATTISSSGTSTTVTRGNINSISSSKADKVIPYPLQQTALLSVDSTGQYVPSGIYNISTETELASILTDNAIPYIQINLLEDVTYTSSTWLNGGSNNILFTGKKLKFSASSVDLSTYVSLSVTFHNIVEAIGTSNNLTFNASTSFYLNFTSIVGNIVTFASSTNKTFTVIYQDSTATLALSGSATTVTNGNVGGIIGDDTRTVTLGSVSGTVNVDMSAGVQFTATMGNSTTFNFTNIVVNKPIFIKVTGAFTITLVTTGVLFHYITVDAYDHTKSMLWVMFTDSTNANYNFKNID